MQAASMEYLGWVVELVMLAEEPQSSEHHDINERLRAYRLGSSAKASTAMGPLWDDYLVTLYQVDLFWEKVHRFQRRPGNYHAAIQREQLRVLLKLLTFVRTCVWHNVAGASGTLAKLKAAAQLMQQRGCCSIFAFNAESAIEKWYEVVYNAAGTTQQQQLPVSPPQAASAFGGNATPQNHPMLEEGLMTPLLHEQQD